MRKNNLKKLEKYFLIFITYAFLGWIYEEIWFLIVKNTLVNRGFLFGPYLPIYGLGALILYFMLWNFKTKKHKLGKINITPIIVFILIFLVTTIVEYISHFILDEFFNIVLWDYTHDYLNINGRVCFAASRNFAIGGTFCLYLIQPLLEKLDTIKNKKVLHIISILSVTIVIIDLIITLTTNYL